LRWENTVNWIEDRGNKIINNAIYVGICQWLGIFIYQWAEIAVEIGGLALLRKLGQIGREGMIILVEKINIWDFLVDI
jgi:hypothetical protein